MTVPITIVDAFTSVPFRGNPAAVCVLSSPRDGVWMQDVAREMSLSETAFVSPRSDGVGDPRVSHSDHSGPQRVLAEGVGLRASGASRR